MCCTQATHKSVSACPPHATAVACAATVASAANGEPVVTEQQDVFMTMTTAHIPDAGKTTGLWTLLTPAQPSAHWSNIYLRPRHSHACKEGVPSPASSIASAKVLQHHGVERYERAKGNGEGTRTSNNWTLRTSVASAMLWLKSIPEKPPELKFRIAICSAQKNTQLTKPISRVWVTFIVSLSMRSHSKFRSNNRFCEAHVACMSALVTRHLPALLWGC